MEKIRYTVVNTATFTDEVWIDRYCVGTEGSCVFQFSLLICYLSIIYFQLKD